MKVECNSVWTKATQKLYTCIMIHVDGYSVLSVLPNSQYSLAGRRVGLASF